VFASRKYLKNAAKHFGVPSPNPIPGENELSARYLPNFEHKSARNTLVLLKHSDQLLSLDGLGNEDPLSSSLRDPRKRKIPPSSASATKSKATSSFLTMNRDTRSSSPLSWSNSPQ
jgi:hypothetical protein